METAETRRLRWFFGSDRRRNSETSVGHVALPGQVAVFLKPSLGVKSEHRFQDTVEEHDSLGFPPDNRFIFRRSQFQGFKNECARQWCDGFKERLGQPMSLYVPLSKGTHSWHANERTPHHF